MGLPSQMPAGKANVPAQPDANKAQAAATPDAGTDYAWPVAEHFCSINGEGAHAGTLAAFIRFPRCNLSCSYCDTAWANEPHCETEEMTLADLVAFISSTGAVRITLTGGEPLLQPHFDQLIFGLLAADPDWKVEIETNGAASLHEAANARKAWAHQRVQMLMGADDGQLITHLNRKNLFERQMERVSFTMDWKLPSSGMEQFMLPQNLELLEAHDALKFVCGTSEDLQRAQELIDEQGLRERANVFFSPVFGQMDPADLVGFLQEQRLAHARVQLQMHKIIWPNVEKGV